MRHVAADEGDEVSRGRHDGVFGSNRRVGDVLVLVENRGGDARAAGVFHPDDPRAIVFKGGAEDVALAAVLGEGLAPVGLVVDEGFHPDGHEGRGVVVVGPVDMSVGGDLWEQIGLSQEKQLAFGLRDDLAPQVAREGGGGATEDADEVVL